MSANIFPSVPELAAAFASRRCVICGGAADVVAPGQEAVWETRVYRRDDGGTLRRQVLVVADIPDVQLCLADAATRWARPAGKRRSAAL